MPKSETEIDRRDAALRLGPIATVGILAVTGVLAAITARECHFNLLISGTQAPFTPSLLYGVTTWSWWAALTLGLWYFAARRSSVFRLSLKSITIHAVIASVLAAAHLILLQFVIGLASAHWQSWGRVYHSFGVVNPERFGWDLLLYGFIYGVSCLLYSRIQNQRTLIQKLELERQLTQAQLKALQMQMEPHFLFNTLNALASLVKLGRTGEASKTLEHLDTILRTTLRRGSPEKVPFVEELRVVESYLAIQQVRFAHRLRVTIEASPEALQGLVPCFILQPLVENAIQHGIAPLESGGLIETTVKRVGDRLWMQVRDNGPGKSPAKGHGIGIQNTRERLAYFYPNSHEFQAVAPVTGGYEVTIDIPYERSQS